MRRFFILFVLSFLMISCTPNSPKSVAKKFADCLAKGKVEEAKNYATETTAKVLDISVEMNAIDIDPDFKFVFLKDSIVGNRAWVTYKNSNTGEEEVLELVKIDGDWLVNVENTK